MKKELVNCILILFLFIFLISGIFAVGEGNCSIVARAECDDTETEGYVVMGISSSTNAHGEFPDIGTYPYVLCCNFGDGDTTCTTDNKIIGLSSSTNAHAEIPTLTNYLTDVCYEDFECIGTTYNCGEVGSEAEIYPMGFISLSADTNAHIGGFDDYPVKICCSSVLATYATCELESAQWNRDTAQEGQRVYLQVGGSGPECSGAGVSFEVFEDDEGSATTNPSSVSFSGISAMSIWYAEWVDDGILEGDPEYYFIATLVNNPESSLQSSNELTVTQWEGNCIDIVTCGDYDNELDCISDASLCNVADNSGEGIIDCSADDIVCQCFWDEDSGTCGFGYTQLDAGEDCDPATDPSCCEPGETLCSDDVCREDCSGVGDTCNNDGVCDSDEGCTCLDCDGKQDSCDAGAICSAFFGACACNYGFTLCIDSNGFSYCNLGDSCPGTDAPTGLPENNNGTCDFGIDGCLSPDCQDGDQDTCVIGTYCIEGMCSSLEGPVISFGSCEISQTVEKGCDEEPVGYKIVNWEGEWTGEPSGAAYEICIAGGTRSIPCPAQIQLPFFDYIELIITSVVIAGIYILLIIKSKLRNKRRK